MRNDRTVDALPPSKVRIVGRPVRRAAVWTGFPAAAVMLVALGHVFADAVGGFDHGVVGRLATVVAAVPEPARSIGVWSIAVLSGLGVAVVAQWPDRWVCADGSGLTSGSLAGAGDRLPVSLVSAVFTDGLDLVVIDTSGRQWCRVRPEQDAARIGDALAGLGYPWRGVDPYAASFRPWTPGTAFSSPRVEQLMRRRGAALADWTDVRLRRVTEDLRACGVVVRDDGRRQYWRSGG